MTKVPEGLAHSLFSTNCCVTCYQPQHARRRSRTTNGERRTTNDQLPATGHQPRITNDEKGFTLIELVMVIAVGLVLLLVALPKFQATDSARVSGAARAIAADIRYVQSMAIATRMNHRIVFAAGTTYYVEKYESGAWSSAVAHPNRPGNYTVDLTNDFSGVSIGSPLTVTFDQLGAPVSGAGGSFSISCSGTAKTITIMQHTGRVQIQ